MTQLERRLEEQGETEGEETEGEETEGEETEGEETEGGDGNAVVEETRAFTGTGQLLIVRETTGLGCVYVFDGAHITEPDFRDDLDNRTDAVIYDIDGTCTMHDYCECEYDVEDCCLCCDKPCYVRLPDSEIGEPVTYDSGYY